MSRPEAERREWNARDFGTIVHTVVEKFGRHSEVREDDDPSRIELWVHDELDRWIRERPQEFAEPFHLIWERYRKREFPCP